MNSNRWSQVEEIFHQALEQPTLERNRFLAEACSNDPELLSEVQSLLESDDNAESLVNSLIVNDLKELTESSLVSDLGMHVGPYLLVRELDSGGMGVVYLAVRSDDHYFQIVAIKMIRRGLDSADMLLRFRVERQILATLNHPNIGKILDGGETEDGRPFIVMEYVEGQPITLASQSRALSIRQRVELFQSLCSAVHYAHQKLIIHRDIKPSNVMLTPEGVIKLIDFGTSKALEPQLILSDLSPTESGMRMMTPDYASPEQLQGAQLTTASDIYSLGVLLFELLTDTRPYSLRNLSPAAAERFLLEQSRKPSSVPTLSRQSKRELIGDLDKIVVTAMHPDPSQRYSSVQHLHEDLARYLDGRPIAARRASVFYTLQKVFQRNKAAVLTLTSLLFVVLISGLVYRSQSRKAERRVTQVRTLADKAISDMTDKLQRSSASTETQAALFNSALTYLDQLQQSNWDDPRLLLELSKAYVRVGDLDGSPFVPNLGNSNLAVGSYQKALRTALAANARLPGDESTEALIQAYQRLGQIEGFLGNLQEAHDNYQQGLVWARRYWERKPHDPARKVLLAREYLGLGNVELSNLKPDLAVERYSAAFQICGDVATGEEEHDQVLTRLDLAMSAGYNELGRQRQAIEYNRKAESIAEALVQKYPSSMPARRALFEVYQDSIQPLEARDALNIADSAQAQLYARKAFEIAQMLVGVDRGNVQAQSDLASAYADVGDSFRLTNHQVAGIWYQKSISLTKRLTPHYGAGARHWLAIRDEALAETLDGRENAPESLRLLLEANSIRRELAETSPHGRLHLMRSYCKLSDAELSLDDPGKAQQYAIAALPLLKQFDPGSPSLLVLRDVGFCDASEGAIQHRLASDQALPPPERRAAEAESRGWYIKSDAVWTTWVRRDAATPEGESERHRVEHLLQERQPERQPGHTPSGG
jgi:eukaryotic-like serine/threonine-protein kinase